MLRKQRNDQDPLKNQSRRPATNPESDPVYDLGVKVRVNPNPKVSENNPKGPKFK